MTKRPEALRETSSAREFGIQENDLWIVSVAVTHDLYLITRDTKLERILDVASRLFAYDRYEYWSAASSPPA
jgi:predicted nucleic acid-binding protein